MQGISVSFGKSDLSRDVALYEPLLNGSFVVPGDLHTVVKIVIVAVVEDEDSRAEE